MICEPCKVVLHDACLGGTWCDCQHKPPAQILTPAGIESGEAVGEIGG